MSFCAIMGPKQKALQVNFEPDIYGTFAEIGAGQEVARHFFRAGGAAGTIAKSMSAYDMTVSDSVYGREKSGRYVCETRLEKMLIREYEQLEERLQESRGKSTRFFVFADTVATTSFKNRKDGHGWLGIRFQSRPGGPPSQIHIHVILKDKQPLQQQQTLGIVGVNLLHACFFNRDDSTYFLRTLMDEVPLQSLEINMVRIQGEAFAHFDERLLNLELVKRGYSQAILFDQKGRPEQPSDLLYRKNLVVVRGSFKPVSYLNMDMLEAGEKSLLKELEEENPVTMLLPEISMGRLYQKGEVDNPDFLTRVDLLTLMGLPVLITNKGNIDDLGEYLASVSKKKIAIVMTPYNLRKFIVAENQVSDDGSLYTALGKLFSGRTKIFVYPSVFDESNKLYQLEDIEFDGNLNILMEFLIKKGNIRPIKKFKKSVVGLWSQKLLEMIQSGEKDWEKAVPEEVAKHIKGKDLFINFKK